MTDVLSQPVRKSGHSETLYFFDGYVSVEVISGKPEQRAVVLALLAQAQEMALALKPLANTQCEGHADCGGHRPGLCPPCRAQAVLRAAGVLL